MRKTLKLKAFTVFLLMVLFGGSAALSIAMMESVFSIGIACILGGGALLVAISMFGRKRK